MAKAKVVVVVALPLVEEGLGVQEAVENQLGQPQ